MIPKTHKPLARVALFVALATIGVVPRASAIAPIKLAGALEGRVSNDGGQPQMGAVVQLYDRQEKLVNRALTNDEGMFVFGGLLPDVYSIRVTLGTFLPAMRDRILIEAGKSSLLDINLSGLFSSIRLLPPSSRGNKLGDDDWKWVLRSSSITRPIFRYLPQDPGTVESASARTPIFTDSRGLVSLSAGDASGGNAGELGTAFAFSTNLFGENQLDIAGDVGYVPSSLSPSAAVRATFSRSVGEASPAIALTMRQLYLPRWAGSYESGSIPGANLPPLRSASASFADRAQITDNIDLQYGVQMDSVSLLDHLHYFSPYARLTYSLGKGGSLDVTYTAGNARPELGSPHSTGADGELQNDVVALNQMAPVTLRSGHTKAQRGENYEVGYSLRRGSREVRFSGYRESVQDAALMVAGADEASFSGDLVPDLYTDSLLFNAGNYHTLGYTASLTQGLGDDYEVTVTYGSVGVLAPRSDHLNAGSADELRALIRPSQREALSTRVSGTIRRSGTHFVASYQIMNNHAATAGHLYSTDSLQPDPGLNFSIRQPVPGVLGLPFRMEATLDIRNLLAEGYLPVSLPDGSQLLLVHTPRSVRGGVNFRF